MAIRFGCFVGGLVLISLGFLLGCGSSSSTPAGILLLTSQGAASVSSFGINLTGGDLTVLNTSAGTDPAPSAIILDPTGSFAYVATVGANGTNPKITTYSVAKNGTLKKMGEQAAGDNPVSLAMDPAGHFLFVANQGSDDISVFSIGSGGSLSPVSGSPFPTVSGPVSVTVLASGKLLYVANTASDGVSPSGVSAYQIDAGSGALAVVLPRFPFAAGTAPSGVVTAKTVNHSFLYATNSGSNNVSAFIICLALTDSPDCPAADGSLVPVTGSPFSAGQGPLSPAVDPSQTFLLAADNVSNQVSGYRINPTTGALTGLTQTASTGSNPVSLAIHPDGKFVYVANNGANTISSFSLDTVAGSLSPIRNVPTAAQPTAIALK